MPAKLAKQLVNFKTPNYVQLHLKVPEMPIVFISMDLIGPFEITSQVNQYAVPVICMLTNYAMYITQSEKLIMLISDVMY